LHLTRVDDRFDYGEQRRVISMRHCHERESKRLRPYFKTQE
jgi:hypothetical protein